MPPPPHPASPHRLDQRVLGPDPWVGASIRRVYANLQITLHDYIANMTESCGSARTNCTGKARTSVVVVDRAMRWWGVGSEHHG